MIALSVRNVCQALPEACYQMGRLGVERDSRNGRVRVLPGVLLTEYQSPVERVLVDPDRDANPFFHLFEALWMLHGGRDVAWPQQFNSKFGQYSDDGVTFNGAYGWRWRSHFGGDQLRSIIAALRGNPDCRRQVLSMWDARQDLGSSSRDIPCNLNVTFQIAPGGDLDMVVFNRSNDLIWGAYGANAVHFSILQEYVAAHLLVPVGRYTQVSSNTHVYEPHWALAERLATRAPMPPDRRTDPYTEQRQEAFPLASTTMATWDRELDTFMKLQHRAEYRDPFFQHVAKPLFLSWAAFKERTNASRFHNARAHARQCVASDWGRAAVEWLDRREEAARSKGAA